ncbi:hypothetical protein F2P79_000512 [Pimephales promelas]|nr:hypothetical protein F2P79_000512 [Pimephales promelas]
MECLIAQSLRSLSPALKGGGGPPLGDGDSTGKSERVVPYGVTCKHGQIITPSTADQCQTHRPPVIGSAVEGYCRRWTN